jgi:hypothetical protein
LRLEEERNARFQGELRTGRPHAFKQRIAASGQGKRDSDDEGIQRA